MQRRVMHHMDGNHVEDVYPARKVMMRGGGECQTITF